MITKGDNLLATMDVDKFPVVYERPKFDFAGYDEMKAQIDQLTETLKTYQVDPESLAGAKKLRAKLNKLKKAINTRKIEIVKDVDAPVADFKNKVKDLLDEISESNDKINESISIYEKKEKDARHQENVKMIGDICQIAGVKLVEIKYDPRWDNKSFSKNAITNAVDTQIAFIKQREQQKAENQKVIDQKADELALPAEHWLKQLDNQDLAGVLKAMTDYKKELTNIAKTQHETKVAEAKSLKQRGDVYIDAKTGEIKDKVKTISLKFTGTEWQLKQLKGFLIDNGIKYEAI